MADVETYTKGRLQASDPEVQRLFEAALRAARNYCGWHVTPVVDDEVLELDGPGGRVLALPTRKVIDLAIVEDGVTVDVANQCRVSKSMGLVRKRSRGCWTGEYGAITVTMTHGHETAPDFDLAVLKCVDAVALSVGISTQARGSGGKLTKKRVDDVEYNWSDRDVEEALDTSWLDSYRRIIFT
ncbi:hypothetical protein H7J86_24545 [Mycobacterium hackensackense]|uniref:hypothetical protein n=1 Tax=Mycobacterium hackensackense TaxID=228909 RepID=UPI002265D7CD|nr:hypothetical protein [Mycobacterium hackensackense]MCV7255337.1 hypothetical protein [Mycobacterium hackensackense]